MKPIITSIICLLLSISSYSQGVPSVGQKSGSRSSIEGVKGWFHPDSGLVVPQYNAKTSAAGVAFNKPGRIWFSMATDSSFYGWDGVREFKLYSQKDSNEIKSFIPSGSGSGTVTNVSTGYGLLGGPIVDAGTIRVDSNEIANKRYVDSGLANIPASFDTTHIYAALADSIAAVRAEIPPAFDTTHIYSALGDSLQSVLDSLADHWDAIIDLDATKVDKADSNIFGGYTSFNATLDTAADHLALINSKYPASNPNGYTSNTGTVTNIAEGWGATGGTITTTGTRGVDSNLVTSRARLKKVADSVAALSGAGGGKTYIFTAPLYGTPSVTGDTITVSIAATYTRTITETSTIQFPSTLGITQHVTITANDTVSIDSSLLLEGQMYDLTVQQNGTGGKTVYFKESYLYFGGGTTSTGYPYQDIGANEFTLFYIRKVYGKVIVTPFNNISR